MTFGQDFNFYLPGQDSNLDKESQNLLCYRYTTGYREGLSEILVLPDGAIFDKRHEGFKRLVVYDSNRDSLWVTIPFVTWPNETLFNRQGNF